MYIQLHWDDYKALLKGQYTLLPCAECEMGMVYWNGGTWEVISLSEYNRLMEEAPDDHYGCKEECEDCMGLGKVVRFDEEIEDDGSIVLAQDCNSLEAYNVNPMSYQYSEY